jgi:hypothetical protein
MERNNQLKKKMGKQTSMRYTIKGIKNKRNSAILSPNPSSPKKLSIKKIGIAIIRVSKTYRYVFMRKNFGSDNFLRVNKRTGWPAANRLR